MHAPNDESDVATARRVLVVGRVLLVLIAVGLVSLLGRVVQLQIRPDPRIDALIDSQRRKIGLHARRGAIYDRRGRVLVASRVAHQLFVDPQCVEDPNTFAERLGHELQYDPARLAREIGERSRRRWVLIDRELTDSRRRRLRELSLPGVGVQTWMKREYVHGSRAGQVLGFVGREGRGLEGLEWQLDRELREKDGLLRYVGDVARRPLWVEQDGYSPPKAGGSVRLTLDLVIQAFAEEALVRTCHTFAAASGQMIVLDARDGDILAMANYPLFDPADRGGAAPDQRRNRCVTDAMEPGSIFKPIIWSHALEAGVVTLDERINCTAAGFYVSPQGRRLRDTRGHGTLSWTEVLVKSSNIGMAIVGQRLGPAALHDALGRFGFGRTTYCGVPGEANGIVRPLRVWNHYSETSVPIGQEIAATPIQLVTAFTAFAGDGTIVKPRIRFRWDGLANEPIRQRVLSRKTAKATRAVLRGAVTEGTGRRANSKYHAIFGKTGTAQIADRVNGGYLEDQYVASFLCGAPTETPRIVVGCFVHRPDRAIGYYGGTVAAPAAREVVERTLEYLEVAPMSDKGPGRVVRR